MLSNEMFIKQSLEINLFFLRILKEHGLFMQVSFPAKNRDLIQEASLYNQVFNNLLNKSIAISQGVLNIQNDMVTNFTLEAEKATSFVTGIPIDTSLTSQELSLISEPRYTYPQQDLVQYVYNLNNEAIQATQGIINYKTKIINGVLNCTLYTTNYPLLLDHIRREAYLYLDLLNKLQNRSDISIIEDTLKQQAIWNQLMAEHAKFIRGYLDPTEEDLIGIAMNFGQQFDALTKKALQTNQNPMMLTSESYNLTKAYKDFKAQGTEGLLQCKIKSIIAPLLADHVLREANHYLILLEKLKQK